MTNNTFSPEKGKEFLKNLLAQPAFPEQVILYGAGEEAKKVVEEHIQRTEHACKSELTLNIELSPIALKLRTLRLKKNLSFETFSQITGIAVEDLIAFETDKKVPTDEEKQILFDFLK